VKKDGVVNCNEGFFLYNYQTHTVVQFEFAARFLGWSRPAGKKSWPKFDHALVNFGPMPNRIVAPEVKI